MSMKKWDTENTDPWDEYPELRNRAFILFTEQQEEREERRVRELPMWRKACFRLAKFLARYIH